MPLYQICSKVLKSKISKPAMSRTPMKLTFFMVGSMRVRLHRSTSQANMRLYMERASAEIAFKHCVMVISNVA